MLLEIKELVAGYGRITILNQVSIKVKAGEIVCMIGPNGAGKSTVLRAVSGQIRPFGGQVLFQNRNVTFTEPKEKGRQGLIFIPQGENVFPNLSLVENLEIAGYLLRDPKKVRTRMKNVLEAFPWMKERRDRPARELSGGQRQALALGRILLLIPNIVLLDEPSLGLAPLVVDDIFNHIKTLNQSGISFLMVEQNARKGLSVSHRGYVLEQGQNRLDGSGPDLLADERVQKLYLGG